MRVLKSNNSEAGLLKEKMKSGLSTRKRERESLYRMKLVMTGGEVHIVLKDFLLILLNKTTPLKGPS